MYVAVIATGSYEDYQEDNVFCSTDKDKVEKWVNRFNKIVEDNEGRIRERVDKQADNEPWPFWYRFIFWDGACAVIHKIPIR